MAALGLKGADLGLDQIIAQRNPVARIGRGGGLGALFGMGKGKVDVGAHGEPPVGDQRGGLARPRAPAQSEPGM